MGSGAWVVERAATYREVFAVREFRALFFAQLASVTGDQFARVALVVVVYQRTASASLTALTYALTFLPAAVGPLLAGLADRHPRRSVMVAADLVRALLVLVMAVPGMPLAALWVLLVAVQLGAAPFNAARSATLPAVLDGDRYVVAVSVSSMTYQVALLAGFVGGGGLVLWIGASGALLVDAVTFVVSAWLIRSGVQPRPRPQRPDRAPGWLRGVAAGGGLIVRDRRLRMLMVLLCVPAFAVTAEGLAVPYAADLGLGATAVGLLMAADPAGSVVGGWLINRMAPRRRRRWIGPLAVLSCAVLVVVAVRPNLAVTLVVLAASGVASAYLYPVNAEFVRAAPDSQRGQVFGFGQAAMRVAQGAAVLVAGVAAELTRPAVVIAASGAAGAVVAWWAAHGWARAGTSAGVEEPADGTR